MTLMIHTCVEANGGNCGCGEGGNCGCGEGVAMAVFHFFCIVVPKATVLRWR